MEGAAPPLNRNSDEDDDDSQPLLTMGALEQEPQPSTSSTPTDAERINEKSHTCETCHKSFPNTFNLRRHQRSKHKNDSIRVSCKLCEKSFARGDHLRRHMDRKHRGGGEIITQNNDRDEMRSSQNDNRDELRFPPTTGDDELDQVLKQYWSSIKSKTRRGKVLNVLNVRLWNGETGEEGYDESARHLLQQLWDETTVRVKINCSFGCILEHKTSGELRYYHSSSNNATVLETARSIATSQQLENFYSDVVNVDIREMAIQRRPSTEWKLKHVTNITFYMYKLLDMGKVGHAPETLPTCISSNKSVVAMNKLRGRTFSDNLCFFRCLAMVLNCPCSQNTTCKCDVKKTLVGGRAIELFNRFKEASGDDDIGCAKTFAGVQYEDLVSLEKLFDIRVFVYTLCTNKLANVLWSSQQKSGKKLHVIDYDGHFCWIRNVDTFAKAFLCEDCGTSYTQRYKLQVHKCAVKTEKIQRFVGGSFCPSNTIFDEITEQSGIEIKNELRFHPYRITFDIECLLYKDQLPDGSESRSFVNRHELASISVCSNVPGYEESACFVRDHDTSPLELVEQFYSHITLIATKSARLLTKRYTSIRKRLLERIVSSTNVEREYATRAPLGKLCGFSDGNRQMERKNRFQTLIERLETFASVIPVVGFNSQKYDLNVLKPHLIRVLSSADDSNIQFVVKKLNNMTCIETNQFRFLDICNFIAPGFSYSKYLKAFGCQEEKGFFPYEWFDSIEKLKAQSLPPKLAFSSSLRNTTISDEDYSYCQQVWKEQNMRCFKDFLMWYNNLDVKPFLEAIEKQSSIYREKGIDMLKSAVSLPGLAIRWLFEDSDKYTVRASYQNCERTNVGLFRAFRDDAKIHLIDRHNSDLYNLIKDGIVGGPSIVFSRHHEKDKTRLRPAEYADAKTCKEILGVDANALYLWCMMQKMPVGSPKRWRIKDETAPDTFVLSASSKSKVAHCWLSYVSYRENVFIHNEHNDREIRIGDRELPVDGFCKETQTIYQFHGCFWHGHQCAKNDGITTHPTRDVPMAQLHVETMAREEYMRKLGYRLVSVWECEWEETLSVDEEAKNFSKVFFASLYKSRKQELSMSQAVTKIKDGSFYGLIQCDIHVPAELEKKFSEMAPIFKNTLIGREHLSPTMLEFAKSSNYLERPQKMLVGSLKGEKILLYSELLRWYLRHGLEVTKIYQLVEYIPRKTFEKFGKSVTEARRMGDLDSTKQLLADTNKLIGNSCYGKTITNKDRHRDVKYVEGDRAVSVKIRSNRFCSAEEIDDGLYETVSLKTKNVMDTASVVGFVILQNAKLRMLEFYYDFMDRYVDRRDFEYVEMDTDSAYMALSGPLDSLIREGMREEFYQEYENWFPRPFCPRHREEFLDRETWSEEKASRECCSKTKKFDCRTPGLFKTEFSGDGIIALNSKTYYCWKESDGSVKYSSKGLSKTTNALNKEAFLDVLYSRKSLCGVNKGFAHLNNQTFTYSQSRRGLSWQYAKRRVLDDGVSTKNILV